MQWYERARSVLERLSMSHESLAERIGRGRSTISGWFNGTREPRLDEIFAIADALGVTRQWLLFGGEGEEQPVVKFADAIEVSIWNGKTKTESTVTVPGVTGTNLKAFKITDDTGCIEVPGNSLVVVNPSETAINKDLLYVAIGDTYSVYRLLEAGGKRYLSIDDVRVPVIPIDDSVDVIGVIVFISRNLKN